MRTWETDYHSKMKKDYSNISMIQGLSELTTSGNHAELRSMGSKLVVLEGDFKERILGLKKVIFDNISEILID